MLLNELFDEDLLAGITQAKIGDSNWWVHFRSSASPDVYELRCVVTHNGDHGKPEIDDQTTEFVLRRPKTQLPFRFRFWNPPKTESYICLVTFESMRDCSVRVDYNQLAIMEPDEGPPSNFWQWKDLPF